MPKKLVVFGFLFILLAGLSIFLIFKGKPPEMAVPILLSVGEENISKVVIEEPTRSATLEKKEGVWRITAPLDDAADAGVMDQLLGTLTSFTVESVISEKKDKYASFDLEKGQATHVLVFQNGKDKPVLDAYVGKQAVSYGTSYFRYADKNPVYIAENLPNWVLIKVAPEYRQKKLIPILNESVTQFSATAPSGTISFKHAGSTWVRTSDGEVVDSRLIGSIVEKSLELEGSEFEDTLDPKVKSGLEKPYLSFSVESASSSVKAVIGNKKIVKKTEGPYDLRYAKTDGRNVVLLIGSPAVEEIVTLLKNLPAPFKK